MPAVGRAHPGPISRVLDVSAGATLGIATIVGLTSLAPLIQMVSILVVAAACLLANRLQPRQGEVISPLDLFIMVALIHGSWLPTFEVVFGPPTLDFRRVVPSDAAIQASMASTIFVLSVLVGYALLSHRGTRQHAKADSDVGSVAIALITLGIVGLVLRLVLRGGIGDETLVESRDAYGGLVGLLSTWLTPLLPLGTFGYLQARRKAAISMLFGLALVVVSGLAFLSFSLNRAVFLVPIIAMVICADGSHHGRRLLRRLTVAGVIGTFVFLVVGLWRTRLNWRAAGYEPAATQDMSDYARMSFEVYFQSPYLVGEVYEAGASERFSIESLMGSVLRPIPALGDSFRGTSGQDVYNFLIYGSRSDDQILPLWAEVDRSLGLVPLILAGMLVGLLLRWIGRRASAANGQLQRYAYILSALWVAQTPIISLTILAQVAFYFLLPVLVTSSMLRPRQQDVESSQGLLRGE